MNSRDGITSDQKASFTTLFVGIFLHSPLIPTEALHGITENSILQRYGPSFPKSLNTFGRLSAAEQTFLVHHLQQ